jgi:hypothetical protein
MMRRSSTDANIDLAERLFGAWFAIMNLDPQALRVATQTLDRLLSAEADGQRAYLFHFPDGRISLELEWIDIYAIIRAVIATYMDQVNKPPAR